MLEKDAEEIAKDIYIHHFDEDVNYPDVLKAITVGVQKGAEHGYNKANKWYYVKDGLFPKEGETVICFCRGYCGASFCATARLYIGYDDKVRRWWTNAGEGKSEQLMDVIAWKEIVFPKEV